LVSNLSLAYTNTYKLDHFFLHSSGVRGLVLTLCGFPYLTTGYLSVEKIVLQRQSRVVIFTLTLKQTHTHTNTQTQTHTYKHTNTNTHIQTHKKRHKHTHSNTHKHTKTTQTHTHTYKLFLRYTDGHKLMLRHTHTIRHTHWYKSLTFIFLGPIHTQYSYAQYCDIAIKRYCNKKIKRHFFVKILLLHSKI